ncbi:MAG TPA: heavy metal sensor histidine kinase [Geobacteraceae bacterium]|nr:heavy metal sensor histidine kinase [Geobacteraceae bacterium]
MSIQPPFKRPLPLSVKLTAHYTLSAFLILLVASILMYLGLVSSFSRRNTQYLDSQFQLVREMLLKGDAEALKREIMYEHAAPEYIRHYERVLDGKGRLVLETPNMGKLLPPDVFTTRADSDPAITQQFINGNLYNLRSATVHLPGGEERLLQIALEISQVEKIRADYRDQLLSVLFVGVLLCAAAGAYIVRRDLLPLREITETARHITVSNLKERINTPSLPKELEVLAKSFDDMLDRLENSFQSISNYSAHLAHELRTPISILMGEAEVTLSRPRSAEEYRQVIVSSLEECQRLTRLIESLMFLARFDKNEIPLKPEEVDIRELVTDTWEYYGPLVEEHGITFECIGTMTVHGDRELLRRAIGNLLHNAIVYNRSGGKVTVAMHRNEDHTAGISVSDTGFGISPDDLPRVFDRFQQSGRARQLSPMWPGLVLPIVKAIMELHGGTITVASEQGKGTTFTLLFPPPRPDIPGKMTKS